LLIASHSHFGLARVEAATLPRSNRVTIHWHWRRADLPHIASDLATEDVDRSDHISMCLKPTDRAAVYAPRRFVAMIAVRIGTGFARMLLIDQKNTHAFRLSLVAQIGTQLAVPPGAQPLVLLSSSAPAIRNVAHIPDRECPSLLLNNIPHQAVLRLSIVDNS
jgi:hypothetical protein